ncbi:MAG: penicillin-binding protein 2, partial [Nitrospirae bacterium]|nr:penicillin-binding protein 2 [Nitrospirota bacterium]
AHIEARKSDFPGLLIETEITREYLFGKTGSHLIGYLGKMTPPQFKDPKLKKFPSDAFIGQWGVEALYDDMLRGRSGEKVVAVDALGMELSVIQNTPPVKGDDIYLSIDINIHKALEDSFGEKAGAVVAVKPGTGEILAIESFPSFDPNMFARVRENRGWAFLEKNKKNPLLNRAIQSQYPPASTFKIITAIAALEEGIIDPDAKINCTGGISYGKHTFGCWKKGGHGPVDMRSALVESCDVYFYEIGKRLGIEKIHKYAAMFGLGKVTGFEIVPAKEKKGLVPDSAWKKKEKGQPWYLGDTFISAIGQGYMSATPIQMAMLTATFANGGYIYKPSLLKGGNEPLDAIRLQPDTVSLIREALTGVVNDPNGTAQSARSAIVTIAGKTGTAQVVSKKKATGAEKYMDHAWFVAFAPPVNPEIAIAVFVEHGGSGASAAAPVAKRAIEAYFTGNQKNKPMERQQYLSY